MRLKTVVFYQGVKLWDGNLFQTVSEGDNKGNKGVSIHIENHVITLQCPSQSEIIIVGTSNMREARYWREPNRIHAPPGKIGSGSIIENPTENGTSIETAKSITGSPEQGEHEIVLPVPMAGVGFDPTKYTTSEPEKKVTKPTRSKKETK